MRRCTVGFMVVVVLLMGAQGVKAEILTADVAVYSPGGQYAPFEVGESVSHWVKYYWYDVPAFAKEQNFLFWQYQQTGDPSETDGITTFEVLTDGPVLLACTTRWGGGGNISGDWWDEVTSREQLEEQGWAEFATGLIFTEVGHSYPENGFEWIVFRRDSVAGETFTYRTEKYCPPLIIRSETVIPEPSILILLAAGAFALLAYAWRRRNRPA